MNELKLFNERVCEAYENKKKVVPTHIVRMCEYVKANNIHSHSPSSNTLT